jgi:micrococcal nuclease
VTSDTVRIALAALLVVTSACADPEPLASDSDPTASPTGAPGGDTSVSDPVTVPSPASGRVRPDGPGLPIAVTRVADGDSLRAMGDGLELEIRLIGINAPEGDECLGGEAEARLEQLLASGPVELRPWPAERDEFGRTLGLLTAGDVFVNLALLETGHAVARDQSDHPFVREFEDAEAKAAEAGLGVWARAACGPAATAQIEIVELMANAPGDDRQNPNGEYVVIENVGDTDADLTGWVIRDESTRHRFTFPQFALEAGRRARLRSGCSDDDLAGDPIELFWCDPEPPIWNNDGDTAFLLDSKGNTVDFFRS